MVLFVLTQEFKLPYRSIGMHVFGLDATVETLAEEGLLEERLEFPDAVDGVQLPGYGVYTYRLTEDGRPLAKEMEPRSEGG